ncbi:MAG: glycoside hydrolase family 3 C-terminal domain-containing protein, partial [Dehalococcoidia bacterium]
RINGTYASENEVFLTGILKKEWNFEGFIVSDWGAVHNTVPAANAGVDMEMPGPARCFGEDLVDAVNNREVSEETINNKVRRILSIIDKSGTFDKPLEVSGGTSDTPDNRKLAREAAQEAVVLLKNDSGILPLDRNKVRSVAVIGPNAGEARIQGGGSSKVNPYYAVTPLEAIREKCGDAVDVRYEIGCRNNRLTLPVRLEYLLQPGDGKEKGLFGEYFNNRELSGVPVLTQAEQKFTMSIGGVTGLKPPGVVTDEGDFSLRLSGRFVAPVTGNYAFGLLANGLGKIYIDQKIVVERSKKGADADEFFVRRESVGEYRMDAGRIYDIRVEFIAQPGIDSLMPRHFRLGCSPPLTADAMERAARAAARADAALVFVGLNDEYESEGWDREDMGLPGAQVDLIRSVAGANRNTVVVLNNGSPLSVSEWIDDVPGIVEAWFPGQECGNAIADVLFGDVNPSGKLPVSFPVRYKDNPAFENYPGNDGKVLYAEGVMVGYRYYDTRKVEPMFPFGYGLSYTSFEYSSLQVASEVKRGDILKVKVDVANTGSRAGKEVVQLYIRDIRSSLPRPDKELKGFEKVSLEPGETATVEFEIGNRDLSYYDPDIRDWVAEAGEFEVLAGRSSRDIRCKASFTLKEQAEKYRNG